MADTKVENRDFDRMHHEEWIRDRKELNSKGVRNRRVLGELRKKYMRNSYMAGANGKTKYYGQDLIIDPERLSPYDKQGKRIELTVRLLDKKKPIVAGRKLRLKEVL